MMCAHFIKKNLKKTEEKNLNPHTCIYFVLLATNMDTSKVVIILGEFFDEIFSYQVEGLRRKSVEIRKNQ